MTGNAPVPNVSSTTINLGLITAQDVHISIAPSVVVTTEDRLRLAILAHQDGMRARDAWIAPFSVFLSIVVALATTDFRRFVLAANVWEAVFYICAALSFGWAGWTWLKRPKQPTVDSLILDIKRAGGPKP